MHGGISLELRKLLGNSQDTAPLFGQSVKVICNSYDIAY